jgi:hypothetical protein
MNSDTGRIVMLNKIGEWVLAIAIALVVLALFALGGVLITGIAVACVGVLAMLVLADIILAPFRGLSSLFRRSEATTGRREEKG